MNPLDIFGPFVLFCFFAFLQREKRRKEVSLWQMATTCAVNVPLHKPPPNYAPKTVFQHEWPLGFSQLVIHSFHSFFSVAVFKEQHGVSARALGRGFLYRECALMNCLHLKLPT